MQKRHGRKFTEFTPYLENNNDMFTIITHIYGFK